MGFALVVFFWSVFAFTPLFLVMLGKYPGGFFDRVECLLLDYSSTITSIGILALVSALALLTAHLSNRSSEKRESSNRRVAAELKLAEFRQAWINSMRDDLAEIGELAFRNGDKDTTPKQIRLLAKVIMRLNLTEDLAKGVALAMRKVLKATPEEDDKEKVKLVEALAEASYKYLKEEWIVLQGAIRKAQVSDLEPV